MALDLASLTLGEFGGLTLPDYVTLLLDPEGLAGLGYVAAAAIYSPAFVGDGYTPAGTVDAFAAAQTGDSFQGVRKAGVFKSGLKKGMVR